jgi:hypothetical protein
MLHLFWREKNSIFSFARSLQGKAAAVDHTFRLVSTITFDLLFINFIRFPPNLSALNLQKPFSLSLILGTNKDPLFEVILLHGLIDPL